MSSRYGGSANLRSEDRSREEESSSAQARALLVSLRNVIIPLVEAVVPTQKDLRQVPLGPEAEDFLTALQRYISCIIQNRSHSNISEGIIRTVNLEDISSDTPPVLDSNKEVSTRPAQFKEEKSTIPRSLNDAGIRPQHENLASLDEALTTLRVHVFNEMPMRLLCFEKRDSNLNITLLDRPGIYSYIASRIKDKVYTQTFGESSLTWISDIAAYAILSHTWLRSSHGEVTYDDWHKGSLDLTHPGYQKLVNFCHVAAGDYGISLGWMDTVCINKESSAELDESIRSMYKWYQKAKICVTYLSETTALSDMAKDSWFSRGWTLQELLAPQSIKFYGATWKKLNNDLSNDKQNRDVEKEIRIATTIVPEELISPAAAPISRKMQWAANRQVTRGEDAAYSLMGIFNINMSIAYGEGPELAFFRLVKEVLSATKSDVLDIFNWAGEDHTDISALLPSSAKAYLQRYSRNRVNFGRAILIEPLALTHLGLRIPVLLLPAAPESSPNPSFTPIGDYFATVNIQPMFPEHKLARSYNILDAKAPKSDMTRFGSSFSNIKRLTFAILNCRGDESHIFIPENCLAVAILHNEPVGMVSPLGIKRKIPTDEPIVFQLEKITRAPDTRQSREFDTVERSQLASHGMQFLTMYL